MRSGLHSLFRPTPIVLIHLGRIALLLALTAANEVLAADQAIPPARGPTMTPALQTNSIVGVGLQIATNAAGVLIQRVMPDSPAERAGLRAGDLILKVDGKPVANLGVAAVAQQLRGELGTRVSVTIQRPNGSARRARPQEFTLERARILFVEPAPGPSPDATDLEELLVAKETQVAVARQRNRSLVAAKTLTLPALLRAKKTADLTALIVRLEQVMLDLNHEAEMEKDRAQRAAEQNPQAVDSHRELAVAYRERIEVLKPIGAAIKEEIANRAK